MARQARVLVVDDDAETLDLLREIISKEGYQVDTAASGEAALSLVGRNQPDIVITDLHMPGMEFASEVVVKATLMKMKIAEVPTTLSPDGRRLAAVVADTVIDCNEMAVAEGFGTLRARDPRDRRAVPRAGDDLGEHVLERRVDVRAEDRLEPKQPAHGRHDGGGTTRSKGRRSSARPLRLRSSWPS